MHYLDISTQLNQLNENFSKVKDGFVLNNMVL